MGKVLLARGSPLPPGVALERYTPNTLVRAKQLDAEVEVIRTVGHAVNNKERVLGVRAAAAPVHGADGRVVAAVAVQGPTVRPTDGRLLELVAEVRKTAAAISATGAGTWDAMVRPAGGRGLNAAG